MTDVAIKHARRVLDDSRTDVHGMTVGLTKVHIDAAMLERLCRLAEKTKAMTDEQQNSVTPEWLRSIAERVRTSVSVGPNGGQAKPIYAADALDKAAEALREARSEAHEIANVRNAALLRLDQVRVDNTRLAEENRRLREALQPLARLRLPSNPQGNAGAYSIRHDDIRAAGEALNEATRDLDELTRISQETGQYD